MIMGAQHTINEKAKVLRKYINSAMQVPELDVDWRSPPLRQKVIARV